MHCASFVRLLVHGRPDEKTIIIRRNKYLNNLVERDHRNIKRRVKLMIAFKSFRRAQMVLAGIDLIHMLRQGQYQPPGGDSPPPAEQFYLLTV